MLLFSALMLAVLSYRAYLSLSHVRRSVAPSFFLLFHVYVGSELGAAPEPLSLLSEYHMHME